MREHPSVWADVFSRQGTLSWRVLPYTLAFGAFATLIYILYITTCRFLTLEVAPHEVAGVLLGLLLVARTNAGYDRWWEGRKLWGGIVNQARNLALLGLAHGPDDRAWREAFIRWVAALPWTMKAGLRSERSVPELLPLLGEQEATRVQAADHMSLYVSLKLDELLRQACEVEDGMDRFAFLQAQRERTALIDHMGGCERIRSTPLARFYSITIRRFIMLYLATLPCALLHKFNADWLAPVVATLVAHAVLVLDQLGIELQHPFSVSSINHLHLNDYCRNIEKNVLALLEQADRPAYSPFPSEGEGSAVA